MVICLINPPQLSTPYQLTDGLMPPLGIMFLSAVLKQEGFDVHVIDAPGEAPTNRYEHDGIPLRGLGIEAILDSIPGGTRLVGIAGIFSMNHHLLMELARSIKERFPEVIVVVGGSHATAVAEHVMNSRVVDVVCLGESERSLPALCHALERNGWRTIPADLAGIAGIAYRDGERIVVNRDVELIDDVDALPYPDWESVPMQTYYNFKEANGPVWTDRWVPLLSSRGCPYDCAFCSTPSIWRRRWRPRDPVKLVDEIAWLQREHGIQEVHFEDENMSTYPERLKAFCDELVRRDIGIKWQAANGMRAHGLDRELLAKMVASGCTNLVLAPESGSRCLLRDGLNKDIDLDEIARAGRTAHGLGLRTSTFFMMGMPGETRRDVARTLAYLMRLAFAGVDECSIGQFVPLPGSRLFDRLRSEGRIELDDAFFRSLTSMGDLSSSRSWSEHYSNVELKLYQLIGYGLFHFTRLVFHPLSTAGTFANVLNGRQELKSERFLIAKLRRLRGR